MYKPYKKWRLWCCCYRQRIPLRGKNKTCTDRRRTTYQEDHKPFKKKKKKCIHASRQIMINTYGEDETGKSRMGMGHRVTDICYYRSTWNWQSCHAVSNQFPVIDVTRVALLVKQGFSWSKNKHKTIAIFEARTRACGRKPDLRTD